MHTSQEDVRIQARFLPFESCYSGEGHHVFAYRVFGAWVVLMKENLPYNSSGSFSDAEI